MKKIARRPSRRRGATAGTIIRWWAITLLMAGAGPILLAWAAAWLSHAIGINSPSLEAKAFHMLITPSPIEDRVTPFQIYWMEVAGALLALRLIGAMLALTIDRVAKSWIARPLPMFVGIASFAAGFVIITYALITLCVSLASVGPGATNRLAVQERIAIRSIERGVAL